MLDDIAPMLATLSARLPADAEHWAFEYKWDGVRAIAHVQGADVRITSRNRLDITHRYPEIVMGLAAMAGGRLGQRAVVDGEIVALDAQGRPSFELLQRRMNVADRSAVIRRATSVPVIYMVFDLLYLGGDLLLNEPYESRRAKLQTLRTGGKHIQVPPSELGAGEEVLEAARRVGLEGVVAKRLGSVYEPGVRSPDWLKIKLHQRQEFVVGGWLPIRGEGDELGALLLGYFDRGRFRYAGKVGTGFTGAERTRLKKELLQLRRDTEPFTEPSGQREAHWAEPRLVVEVEYRQWTDAGSLRHPSYKGIRTDKDPRDVSRESANENAQ